MIFSKDFDMSLLIILEGDIKNRPYMVDFIKSVPIQLIQSANKAINMGKCITESCVNDDGIKYSITYNDSLNSILIKKDNLADFKEVSKLLIYEYNKDCFDHEVGYVIYNDPSNKKSKKYTLSYELVDNDTKLVEINHSNEKSKVLSKIHIDDIREYQNFTNEQSKKNKVKKLSI